MAKDESREKGAREWIETVLGVQLPNQPLIECLKDGVVLCDLLNKIKPGSCSKYKKSDIAFVCRANIQIYLDGCKKIGIPTTDLFESRDLYDMQRPSAVISNIYALSAASRNINTFQGPYIGVKYADKNERNFTPEQLAKLKSAVPIWSQGDKQIKQSLTHDSYGIIKNKDVTKHTGVQSKWEQGSLSNDLSSKHDSYGIIKNKDATKHTGVQSKWEQGSLSNDLSSKHDSYGIIKNKDATKHTGVQSKWEQGSLSTDTSSKHDSYGIIKNKDSTKHTGVSSKWEQGSLPTDTSSKHDSYGVVKQPDFLKNEKDMEES